MTIYFDEIADLTLSKIASFLVKEAVAYPDVSERFPLPRFAKTTDSTGYGSSISRLPMPLVTMVGGEGGNELSFQADRFSLSWNFNPDDERKNYPGFQSLRAELQAAYSAFAENLLDAGYALRATSSEVLYRNSVTELPGAGLALYLLTGNDDLTARNVTHDRTYAGTRIRFPASDKFAERSVSAGVDSPSDDSTVLWIKVMSEGGGSAFALLDDAHGELIRRFIAFTPPWLRAAWGEVLGEE